MGKLGYGYGSEFHLLRWMGRHRAEFDKRVCEALNVTDVKWFDFKFDRKREIPDRELIGLEFIKHEFVKKYPFVKNDSRFEAAYKDYRKYWPQKGNQMNWDVVGITGETFILCEAKARIGEIEKKHKDDDTSDSAQKRIKAFEFAKREIGVCGSANDWFHNFYQMANRLYILALLKHRNIRAMLLNIYFCGDCVRGRHCPKDAEEWRSTIINEEYEKLGIAGNPFVKERVKDLFLPVDR